ncbi:MAG: polynucleotide adenylyltransferase PcnB [Burkholderiales bacterium]
MIRKFFRRVFNRRAERVDSGPVIIRDHGISRDKVNAAAVKVALQLKQAGYATFIVGGAVRDLLLGKHPKDFDVATDARPEQVQALFRRSRIIGRRFRLVHVMVGRETIEVSTFRGANTNGEDADHDTDANGRVLRDNVYGTQPEDAARRDITINALYYCPASEEIWDYQNGMADIKARVVRLIGDPVTRYREDPVRMLRVVRLAAKLDFAIDSKTRAPIAKLADLLRQVPVARLFDEMLKLLLSGHALQSVQRLRAEGLHHGLLPLLDVVLEQPTGQRFVAAALQNTDTRVLEDKPVSPGFLFAALLWEKVRQASLHNEAQGMRSAQALHDAMDQVILTQSEQLAIPRRFCTTMKEIWSMQPRFLQREGSRPSRLLQHLKFRSGYDFMVLRCTSGELDAELGKWWETFQDADEETRKGMLVMQGAPRRRRRGGRRTKRDAVEVQQQPLALG